MPLCPFMMKYDALRFDIIFLGFNLYYLIDPLYPENSLSFSMFLIGFNEVQSAALLRGRLKDVWRRVRDQTENKFKLLKNPPPEPPPCTAAAGPRRVRDNLLLSKPRPDLDDSDLNFYGMSRK